MRTDALSEMLANEGAQGIFEYALIIAVIALVAAAALRLIGGNVVNTMNNASGRLS